jgi:Ni/Co efflux regulator RcnB
MKWRNALDVGSSNAGIRALRSDIFRHEPWAKLTRQKAWAKARDPVRREKIAAAKRGVVRPAVMAKVRKSNIGRTLNDETRRKMSEAHRRRGTRPPKAGRSWSDHEDAMLRSLPAGDVARRTGRTLRAVYNRRSKLGLGK